MQLTCPNCGARYRVDASQWPTEAGADGSLRFRPRKARCKLCATVFEAMPEDEILELGDPVEVPGPARSAGHAPEPAPEPAPEATAGAAAAGPEWSGPGAPAAHPAGPDPAPTLAAAGMNPIEAAWPAVSGWPEPRAPGVIRFEAPPVPLPATAMASAGQAARTAVRLPGPGALGPAMAQPVATEPPGAPAPGAGITTEAMGALPDDLDEEAEEARPRRWPWVLAALLVAGGLWWWLVASGRIDPTDYGLPPYDPARLPGWAQPAAALFAGLPAPALSVPAVSVPAIELPRTPPPPLDVAAEAVRRPLGDDRQVWEISAIVSNPTDDALGVPPVELLLLDSAGRTVGRWTVRPEAAWLPPGGATRIETSAIAPPAGAERVRVQLKPSEPGRL